MLILYLALKTRSFNCSTLSPYFSVHLSKFFFLVIICHPQGPCVHILDTWGSKFRKCTICTSVKRQVILLFFYQILKVSDHLFRLISLPDVYLGINYDFHSFNSQILVLLIHIINIQGVSKAFKHSYDLHWMEIFWRPHRSWFKVIWILQYKLLIVLFEIIYGLLGNCLTSKWLNYSIAILTQIFHTVKVDHPPI